MKCWFLGRTLTWQSLTHRSFGCLNDACIRACKHSVIVESEAHETLLPWELLVDDGYWGKEDHYFCGVVTGKLISSRKLHSYTHAYGYG